MRSQIGLISLLIRKKHDPAQILFKLALRKELKNCTSVLDIGCGASPTMRELGVPRSVGAEGYQPFIEKTKRENLQDDVVECDVRDISKHFRPQQFDACVAIDLIEHVTKADGMELIRSMETIAKKRVIFFTPNGFLPQQHSTNDDLQEHLSGWEVPEMQKLGYRVIGLLGNKKLRGEYHKLKRSPAFFWGSVSLISQLLSSKRHPERAAAILCIKDLKK